jgi:hypothetical protein
MQYFPYKSTGLHLDGAWFLYYIITLHKLQGQVASNEMRKIRYVPIIYLEKLRKPTTKFGQ